VGGVRPLHEAVLFRDLREALLRAAAGEHADRITRVSVWIGALSHVSEPMMREEWPEIVEGTPAEGSELSIETSTDIYDARASSIVLRTITVLSDEEPPRSPRPP